MHLEHQVNQVLNRLVAILNEKSLQVLGQDAVFPVDYLDGDPEDVLEEHVPMPVDLATLTVILLLSLTTATGMRQKGQPTY